MAKKVAAVPAAWAVVVLSVRRKHESGDGAAVVKVGPDVDLVKDVVVRAFRPFRDHGIWYVLDHEVVSSRNVGEEREVSLRLNLQVPGLSWAFDESLGDDRLSYEVCAGAGAAGRYLRLSARVQSVVLEAWPDGEPAGDDQAEVRKENVAAREVAAVAEKKPRAPRKKRAVAEEEADIPQ